MHALSLLHDITLFVEVARSGGFSRAAEQLGMPPATLSRRIAAMERALGGCLFDSTTRRVVLTQAGERYLQRCGDLVDQARIAHEALRASTEHPVGLIRVSMPVDLGIHHIGPLLPEFARLYPGIHFAFDLSPVNRDLVGGQFDVAIRIGPAKGDLLVTRRIARVAMGLYAAPSYLYQRGAPLQPADLAGHQCLTLRAAPHTTTWQLHGDAGAAEVTVRGRIAANNLGLMRTLAELGMGIAVLSHSLAREALDADRLVRVLPQWALPELPVHVVMSSRLQPANVRAFVDHLASRLAQD